MINDGLMDGRLIFDCFLIDLCMFIRTLYIRGRDDGEAMELKSLVESSSLLYHNVFRDKRIADGT